MRIHGRERLVHQQDVRLDRQRARKAAALLHAAGHLVGKCILEAGQADQLDEFRHLAFDVRFRCARHPQAIGDVLEHGLPGKQPEVLEHHGDAGDRLGHAFVADPDLAGIVRQQAVDAAQQRGLAAARRPDDCDDLALTDVEIDVAEDFERAVVLAQAADADAWLAFRGLRSGADGGVADV